MEANGSRVEPFAALTTGTLKQKQEETKVSCLCEEDDTLRVLKEKFVAVAGADNVIDKDEFVHCFGLKDSFFAKRFFELFDTDKEGTVDLGEFIEGMKLMISGSPQQRLKFLFDVYDTDGSGEIDMEELKLVMKHCIEESKMELGEAALNSLTKALFDMADSDESGAISLDELVAVLEKHPEVLNNLTFSTAKWMLPKPNKKSSTCCKCPKYLTKVYFVNNRKHIIWTTVYVVVNIGLFLTSVRYRHSNVAVILARGCGMCLNFNSALLLLLMLRYTLTWLRMTWLRSFLPLDDHVSYHRTVGYIVVLLSAVHTVSHLVNIGILVITNPGEDLNTLVNNSSNISQPLQLQYWEYIFTLRGNIGYVGPGFAYLSGIILAIVLLVMFIGSLPQIRKNGYFQVFYFTHLFYTLFWIFLILHGPIFWMFFVIPGLAFICEKIVPVLMRTATGSKFYITQVHLLPSKVTQVIISRPKNFEYKPGDYIFIKIPPIAKFESHPFTISSAPEHKDEFTLHIRSVGHWTSSLYDYFYKYDDHGQSTQHISGRNAASADLEICVSSPRRVQEQERRKSVNIQVYIDGPYGTATREIFDTDHAVLVGCGIGVTPFASILQSIMYQHQRLMSSVNNNLLKDRRKSMHTNSEIMTLKKVEFIWINRDNRCFEWFVSLLSKLETMQDEDDQFLEMHMYVTSALSANDMKGFALQMALDAMQQKGETNVVTGLKSALKPGRPKWDEVFEKIDKQKFGNVGVFYCGNPTLAHTLEQHCHARGFEFRKEHF